MTFLADIESAYNRLILTIDRLQKENEQLKQEKDMLKKRLLEISNKDSKK